MKLMWIIFSSALILTKFHGLMSFGVKLEKMYFPSCANAHHVVTDFKVSGKFRNKKTKSLKNRTIFS